MKIYNIGVVAFLLLAGCAPQIAEWTPAESPKENKVDRVVFTHSLHYPAHVERMEAEDKRKFNQFLRNHAPSPSAVSVIIQEYGGHSEKRIKDVERELIKYGVSPDLITVDYDEVEVPHESYHRSKKHHKHKESRGSGVEIIIERYIVIPPSCANFSSKIGDAQQAYNSSNYGCSTEANLGMMVANPRDLIRGRDRSAYDGKVIAAGVNRYENDKIKQITEIATTTITPPGNPSTTSGGGTGAGAY
ncbi:MAG: CpaD family pilus assembly protein [Alphaproteobacteria bacterium]|nr:CpaD family pilus assembly protein [Alphaproteobacteria bacterium]